MGFDAKERGRRESERYAKRGAGRCFFMFALSQSPRTRLSWSLEQASPALIYINKGLSGQSYSSSEAIPIFLNRLKSDFVLVRTV